MSYGLYDCDYILGETEFLNLELMKYSTYLKKKKQIVSLSSSFNPEQYTKFIYRKDFTYDTDHALPTYNNLIYGGRAFHKRIYKPLPLEIEECIPDTSIYERFYSTYTKKKQYARFNSMMKGENFRLSLDGKTIWKNFEKQLRKGNMSSLYLHDYNLNEIESAQEVLIELGKYYTKNTGLIANKFPIQVYNLEDLEKWTPVRKSKYSFQLQYNGFIEDNEIVATHLKTYGERSKLRYNFTYGETYESYLDKIVQFYLQMASLRSINRKILLNFDKDFFFDPQWYRVTLLIDRFYNRSQNQKVKKDVIKKETMVDFVNQLAKSKQYSVPIDRKEGKELLLFVKEKKPDLYEAFSSYRIEEG